jgi:uncharacterized cupredoxin-like copper-binding protein
MFRRHISGLAITIVALVFSVQPAMAHESWTQATVITVTAGKPSEFRFRLSKQSVPKGTVTFKITNRGTLPHDFKIAGKKTRLLPPGKSQILVVNLKKAGRYAYLCTVTGHAAAGMKGTLKATGRALSPPRTSTDAVTAGAPSEFGFTLAKRTVPHGKVIFKITNKGSLSHDFKIAGKKTKLLSPGGSQTLTVTFRKAGRYQYLCTVSGHAAAGMRGTLKVT